MNSVITIAELPDCALDAAQMFMTEHLEVIKGHLNGGSNIVIVMPHAGNDQADWRRAAIRDLARSFAPARANMTTTGDSGALEAMTGYLNGAEAVTGQYLPLN